MSAPLVSVVIPMYNDRPTIDLCLRSVREQSYPHIQVIVVDDASTDGCADIAATHPVQLVRVKENGGPGSSRNEGVRRSRGEIVFFLDADLTMHPEAVAQAVALFDENPTYGAVFGIPDKEPLFEEGLVGQYRILQYHYWRKSAEGLVSGGFYALGAVRKAAFMEAGWFNTALRQTEEIDHAERLAARWPMLLTSRIRGRLSDESRMRPLLRKAFVRSRLRVPFYFDRGRAMQGMETGGRAVASALGGLAVAAVPFALLHPAALLVSLAALLGSVAADFGQYRFSFRERGLFFTAFFTGAHALVSTAVVTGLAAGLVQYAASRRFRHMYQPQESLA
ncbi:glycosyltransferase family 2 protein [Streptomyces sp. NPDC091278]|uniref:glycosyltransferase family 2 protein n=1 Tax=Streptomyces sp. NPDC091278 TaxID=3155301 RepID=UPI00344BE49C